jgi:hypothetical protein
MDPVSCLVYLTFELHLVYLTEKYRILPKNTQFGLVYLNCRGTI